MNTEVVHKGVPVYHLNGALIKLNKLSEMDVETLKGLHVEKLDLFDKMRDTDDIPLLRAYAAAVREVEFEMQRTWKFPVDENFHEWYEVPKCKCPKLDNAERRGTHYRVITSSCPVHG